MITITKMVNKKEINNNIVLSYGYMNPLHAPKNANTNTFFHNFLLCSVVHRI